ncbi:MAG: hypothetical protein ACYDGR_07715 [Candidatus Dormibacteria bacterium]
MSSDQEPLSETQIMAAASSILVGAGYRHSENALGTEWTADAARLFEDPISVAGIYVFPTWAELKNRWTEAQSSLVTVMTESISSADPKVWDGYLVLLTPSTSGGDRSLLEAIRRDTARVRKLVATGDELRHIRDVEHTLGPLLPLDVGGSEPGLGIPGDPLDSLSSLPAMKSIPVEVIHQMVEAFRQQEPLLERLHRSRVGR